jgi:hypothetical protein
MQTRFATGSAESQPWSDGLPIGRTAPTLRPLSLPSVELPPLACAFFAAFACASAVVEVRTDRHAPVSAGLVEEARMDGQTVEQGGGKRTFSVTSDHCCYATKLCCCGSVSVVSKPFFVSSWNR